MGVLPPPRPLGERRASVDRDRVRERPGLHLPCRPLLRVAGHCACLPHPGGGCEKRPARPVPAEVDAAALAPALEVLEVQGRWWCGCCGKRGEASQRASYERASTSRPQVCSESLAVVEVCAEVCSCGGSVWQQKPLNASYLRESRRAFVAGSCLGTENNLPSEHCMDEQTEGPTDGRNPRLMRRRRRRGAAMAGSQNRRNDVDSRQVPVLVQSSPVQHGTAQTCLPALVTCECWQVPSVVPYLTPYLPKQLG